MSSRKCNSTISHQSIFVGRITSLIALRLGVGEHEVTDDFIRARRAKRKLDHDGTNSIVGGRNTDGLEHLSSDKVASALKTFHSMVLEHPDE